MASLHATITDKSGKVVTTSCPPDSKPKKALKYASDLYVWKTEKPATEITTIVIIDTKTKEVFASQG